MKHLLLPRAPRQAVPITLLTAKTYKAWVKRQPQRVVNWLKTLGYSAKPASFCVIPDVKGKAARVLAVLSDPASLWDMAGLPCALPKGVYRLEGDVAIADQEKLALGWLLGSYHYTRYKEREADPSKLAVTARIDFDMVYRMAEAIAFTRDLINTPSEDMGPAELAAAAAAVGKMYGAKVTQIAGDDLLKKNYPGIHAVGRASPRAPRLINLTWGDPKHPHVTLVGKGVCFDTGGLDLKPKNAMNLMKKDMAGAAIALGTAMMVMGRKLPVRLRLLIPAVENMVAANAFRPLDVIKMRNGLTVEITNTDAEGRLILAEALAEATNEKPDLTVDFSTLTGAARTAVGTEISAFFANDDKLAEELFAAGQETEDPLWRLPLEGTYDSMLDSKVADLNNCPDSPYAGAITAALFLQRFYGKNLPWAHLDFMAWNLGKKPGRPEGGEAMGLRAVYRLIEKRAQTR
ncbi:MAG: leucyl aminopeptidase family protein [Alphaproteobacteria bacterium]|nr:leucyl aminopeptidase family protein [Alphaproteobacteria bacterium]